MDFLSIIILGIVQGIAEFLPISSSAHLIIFRDIFGIGASMPKDMALSFDIALHFGTLLAIGLYFFKDFINMITNRSIFNSGIKVGTDDKILTLTQSVYAKDLTYTDGQENEKVK